MRLKITSVFAAVLLSIWCIIPASADSFDPDRSCSVSVILREKNKDEPIVGAVLELFYIASVETNEDGILRYSYVECLEHTDSLLDAPSLVTKLDGTISEYDLSSFKMTTDSEGKASCSDLAAGVYFVKQINAVEGFAPCKSFIVTLPAKASDGYSYEVNASPKTEVTKLTSIVVKKVWNTDSSTKAAESVTVQLLQNGIVVKTAILNEENDWQITYRDMPVSDAYSVVEANIPAGFTATYSQSGDTFVVTNTSTLIQTGQLIWPIPVLAIIGITLICTGALLMQNKRRSNA